MEVPRPGIESEPELRLVLQLQQHQILNPLRLARDQSGASTETSQIINILGHIGNSLIFIFIVGFLFVCFGYLPIYVSVLLILLNLGLLVLDVIDYLPMLIDENIT